MMRRRLLVAAASLAFALPLSAQTTAPSGDPHAGHDMSAMPGMDMAVAPEQADGGTALPAGNAPAPAPPTDHYADRIFPPAEMARLREALRGEHGSGNFHQILFNLAEYQARKGGDGYRWDGEAWFGGDINRLTLKSEGEGAVRGGVDSAEVQALYSRAIDPYWNLQAGVRHDIRPRPSRTYATIGVEGLMPYMVEVEGALFLSDKGDLLARAEGYYDQRITQRLILQPRIELNFAAQDVPKDRIGSGLSNAELGLRLRYEIKREFAPYVGVSYDRKVGDTASYARQDGEHVGSTSLVIGIRSWF
jgi:copper resistance protein B